MYKYLLWDHDGVLVDTERWYYLATQRALSELGVSLDLPQYMTLMVAGQGCWHLAREAGCDERRIEAARDLRNRYYQEYLATRDIEIPGVLATLERLEKRCRMAIVTTSRGVDFELIHRRRRIVPLMDFVLVREDYLRSKPDPEPYLVALDRFGAEPSEALVIEDSRRGMLAALAAGLDCAIVDNAFTRSQDFSGSRYRLQSIREVPDLLSPGRESPPTA